MIPLAVSNRHGLIAGTTGGGKSVTLMHLAVHWVGSGVPVLLVDCKGDLRKVSKLVATETLRPITVPVCEFTSREFAELLDTTEPGAAVLSDIWRDFDSCAQWPVTLADLRGELKGVGNLKKAPTATLAQLARCLGRIEGDGLARMFATPVFIPSELLGESRIMLLDARQAISQPNVYRAMVQWLLGEMLQWSDVGDSQLRLVILVDEAHLLFDDAKTGLHKMLIAMRMLRSRGVGVYYATQCPEDLPEKLLSLLGHKIIHALRVFTPTARERARVLGLEVGASAQQLSSLAIGHCYTSILQENGAPQLWSGRIPAQRELL